MLAPEHPSPLQSSQVYVLLLALQGSLSFFQKKNIRPHVTRVRIVRLRINDCPSEPPAWKEVPPVPWSASLLKQRHCKRKRSDTRQDRSPSSEPCRFRAASHQCRSIRCIGLREHLQELGRLIRPPPAHLSRKNCPARDLLQTTEGKCVPSSGEQPLMKTHLATLHLFWLCHPFSGDKPESCRSQIMRLQRGTIRPPRLPEGVRPSH